MHAYQARIQAIYQQYTQTPNLSELQNSLSPLADQYHDHIGAGDYLIYIGEKLIDSGDYTAGILLIQTACTRFKHIVNRVTLYLRMAEFHIEKGNTKIGIDCLIKLCTQTVDNYEESIEFNGLTSVWEKYRHLVAEIVPKPLSTNPLPPEKCSMQIRDILALPGDDLLSSLSSHLAELSANGSCLNCLNKWERTVFYIDELCTEVNSGGFSHYLYYCGHHFSKMMQSLEAICAQSALEITEAIQQKFPRNRVPKTLDRIQNTLDTLEEKGITFDAEDTQYYEGVESTLLTQLLSYVLQNQNHFR